MSIFKKEEKIKKIQPEAFPGAPKMRESLAGKAEPGAFERLGRTGETYPGPLMAALSEFEETGLGGLRDYMGAPLPTEGTMYKSAADEIMKTLSGEQYDPSQGEYYQAYRSSVMRELEEAKDRLAARASAGDKFFGGGRIATEGEMEESALGKMAMVLGELAEKERERRLGAVTQALGLTQYEEAAPLQRVAASQQYGALPRLIEQAEMDVEYQEWLRALGDLGISLDVATGLATWQPRVGMLQTGGGEKDWVSDVRGIANMVRGGIAGGQAGAF